MGWYRFCVGRWPVEGLQTHSVSSGQDPGIGTFDFFENGVAPISGKLRGKSKVQSSVRLEDSVHILLSLQLFWDLRVTFLLGFCSYQHLEGSSGLQISFFLHSQLILTAVFADTFSLCLARLPSSPLGPRTSRVGFHFSDLTKR